MADPHRTYEIRCPVHTFVTFNDWERDIISQPAFQWTQFPGTTIVSDTGELTLGDVFANASPV